MAKKKSTIKKVVETVEGWVGMGPKAKKKKATKAPAPTAKKKAKKKVAKKGTKTAKKKKK